MKAIELAFEFGTKVTTALGGVGIVSGAFIDHTGVNYFVKTSAGGNYWPAEQLTLAPTYVVQEQK